MEFLLLLARNCFTHSANVHMFLPILLTLNLHIVDARVFSSLFCLQVIAAAVASDPVKFNEVFLGKPNEAYCAWILDPEKWGGELQSYNILGLYSNVKPENTHSLKCFHAILYVDSISNVYVISEAFFCKERL